MLLDNSLLGYGILITTLIIGGLQDWRSGEVSNWISIPIFFSGMLAFFLRIFFWEDGLISILSFIAMTVITLAALKDWMGGADWKILTGLFGLWPLAGFTALIVAGIWGGLLILLTGYRNVRFPGVTIFAFATGLTFFLEFSIIILNRGVIFLREIAPFLLPFFKL